MRHKSNNKTRPLFTLPLEMTRLVNETRLLLVPCFNLDIYGNLLVVFIIIKNVRKDQKLKSLQDFRTGIDKEQVKTKLLKELYMYVVRVFGGLVLANLISWLPGIILTLTIVISGDISFIPGPVHTVTVILFMMQVATHPIVEIALLKDLRDPFTAFLCYFCGKKSIQEVSKSQTVTA